MIYIDYGVNQIKVAEDSLASLKKSCGSIFDGHSLENGIIWFRSEYQKTVHKYPGDHVYFDQINCFILEGYSFSESKTKAETKLTIELNWLNLYYLTTSR